jgi:hypothetical protein
LNLPSPKSPGKWLKFLPVLLRLIKYNPKTIPKRNGSEFLRLLRSIILVTLFKK